MKNAKNNIGFFTKWDGFPTLGLGMAIVGFGLLWLSFSFVFYILGGALLAVGFFLFIFGNFGRSTESEILDEIHRKCEGISFGEVETDHHFHNRVPTKREEHEFSGFVFDGDVMLKRLKNGSYASSRYRYAKMLLLTDALYVKTRSFSLIADEIKEDTWEIPAAGISDISVRRDSVEKTVGKKTVTLKTCFIVVVYEGGELLLPRDDDVYADEFVVHLKKRYGIA